MEEKMAGVFDLELNEAGHPGDIDDDDIEDAIEVDPMRGVGIYLVDQTLTISLGRGL